MFKKNTEEYEKYVDMRNACYRKRKEKNKTISYFTGFDDGAEFGYNKANEWHYVKDEGTPKVEGHYLVCLRNKDKDIFDCWIYYDKDIGWYSMKVRMKDVYAWKEIVLPELKESE